MSLDKVISMQVLEESTDAILFENFIYHTLNKLRKDPATANKQIVLLMDNATIHKCEIVY